MSSHPALLVLAIAVAAPLLAEIPVGVRLPAALVEAGMLSVLACPAIAGALRSRAGGHVDRLAAAAGAE